MPRSLTVLSFEEASGPIERRLASALAKVALAARHQLFKSAAPHGLSPVQAQILTTLKQRGGMGMGELSERLGLTAATVSDSVAALERRKMVKRERPAEDKRRVQVACTPAGTTLAGSLALWPEFLAEGVTPLPPAEKEALLRGMLRLVGHLIERGLVNDAGMCLSCVHFRPRAHADSERPHHCDLADLPLAGHALRVDCPDHRPAEASVVQLRWRRFWGETSDHPGDSP